ncbi:MAG: FG-GAP repeat protein [Deltaproteobacteria bacterium]|nr:FG-GAP repeat protein [Deltaproteobacteria bacterium]
MALVLAIPAATVHGSAPEAKRGVSVIAPEIGNSAQVLGADAAWMGRIQHHLAEREYAVGPNLHGLQAPNRAHNLRTYFDATGIQVVDRTAVSSPDLLALRLASIGRGAQSLPVAPGEVTSAGARVEIRRPHIVEWYLNSAAGLEHGFTLERRPAGDGSLAVELAVRGARAVLDGERIVFLSATGRQLEYGKLAVLDAEGARLEARFEVPDPGRVRLIVDDRAASYPIEIDPLLAANDATASRAKSVAELVRERRLRRRGQKSSVSYAAVAAEEAAAFARLEAAMAFANGNPVTADAQLESNQASAALGTSVAGAGDVNGDGYADVIVGAPSYDAGEADEGAAFVFLGSASGVPDGNPVTADAQLESNQGSAALGTSVAGAGDVNGDGYADVIVGAPSYDAGEADEGAAFVFLGGASGVADGNPSTADAQLESDQASAALGTSVAGAGDVDADGYADVIAGAPGYDDVEAEEGAAFVFLGSASGVGDGDPLTADAQLESNQANAALGTSVAGAGDVNGDGFGDVIVGAPGYDDLEAEEGAAFVFLGSESGIADGNPGTAATQLESNQASAQLGGSVSAAGDVDGDGYGDVIVGARYYSSGASWGEGAALVFLGGVAGIADGNPATAAVVIKVDGDKVSFGASVSTAGDANGDGYADVIVGAPLYDSGDLAEGAAFLFLGSASGVTSQSVASAAARFESDQADAELGGCVASAGDVNGDGYADLIVGAALYDAGEIDEGAAFVFLGGASAIAGGDPAAADAQLESNQATAWLGTSVSGAGDLNGDGYADVIVGAPTYDAGEVDEGAAFVFLGGASGIADGNPATADTQLEGDQAGAWFGFSVSGAGDVNGDGYADVIVGASDYSAGQTYEGAAFIYLGSATGIADGDPVTADTQLESNQADAYLGWSVSAAGDVNGDGYGDVIVGSAAYSAGEAIEGAAFIFHGGMSGISDGNPTTANAQVEGNQASAWLGSSVSGAGDVNGDGYADVIVGAPEYDAGQVDEGIAAVFLGSDTGIASGNPTTADALIEGDQANALMGASVAGAGDVNGDGYADVIAGASDYDAGEIDEGAAFVILGSATGIPNATPASANAQLEANQPYSWLGASVSGAGDVNGDGYADVIVGASDYDAGKTDEGAAFVFLGGAAGIANGNPATADAQIEARQVEAFLGWSVSGAGDVNGDGFADVIVGATDYDAGEIDEGAAFVFLGNAGADGRTVLARQLRGVAGSIPVEPWGTSYVLDQFKLEMAATHPMGRGRVKLEAEICPPAAPFGDLSCSSQVSPNWIDATATPGGVILSETISGLTSDTLYRWRARVLYAPFGVTETGITPPPNPAHGPWRRASAQAVEADVRTLPEPGMLVMLSSGIALLMRIGGKRLWAGSYRNASR